MASKAEKSVIVPDDGGIVSYIYSFAKKVLATTIRNILFFKLKFNIIC